MTPHEHMTRHVRKLPEGGIAWERRVFTNAAALDPQDLVDAAVDIAWVRLMPKTLERPLLLVEREGSRIVFRVKGFSLDEILAQAA